MDASWARTGKYFAWLSAACIVTAVTLLVLSFAGVTAEVPPDFDAERASSPELTAELLTAWRSTATYHHIFAGFFILTFISLIPVGLALRELFGRGMVKSEILFASLLAGSVVAISGGLIGEGTIAAASAMSSQVEGDALIALGIAFEMVRGFVDEWFLSMSNLLFGIGVYLASIMTVQQRKLSRSWAYL